MLDFDHGFDMHDDSTLIFVRQNGLVGGAVQELRLAPGSKISDLLEKAAKVLGIESTTKVYHTNGMECTDVDNIDDNEIMHISSGEPWRTCEQKHGSQQIVGNYLVQDKLGQGGFGSVFKGVHMETGEVAAVKFVPKSSFQNITDLTRVFQEIQSLRNLRHPHVIKIIGMADHPENVCFFMEFCAGGELRGYVEKKVFLSEDESRHFFKQIIRAVHYIHGKKIIHRDLKLENILLDAANRTKIVDFGLSGYVAPNEKTVTDAGTEAYLAPEVYNGTSIDTDPYKLDVWALGVILYALAHGNLPFSRPDKDTCDKLTNESLPTYMEELSSGFRRIVRVMLIPKPAKRAPVDEITLDSWTTNHRFEGMGEGEDGEAPHFLSTEDPEIVSNSGTVEEVEKLSTPTPTPAPAAPEDLTRRRPPRSSKTTSSLQSGPPPAASPLPSPGRVQTARTDHALNAQDETASPRLRSHKRGGGKGSSGNEKALVAAGAQVIGQRPGGTVSRSSAHQTTAPPSNLRGLTK